MSLDLFVLERGDGAEPFDGLSTLVTLVFLPTKEKQKNQNQKFKFRINTKYISYLCELY